MARVDNPIKSKKLQNKYKTNMQKSTVIDSNKILESEIKNYNSIYNNSKNHNIPGNKSNKRLP